MLVVSHDRDFLDRVVTAVIATEGDGSWIEYAGGYSDMLAQRGPARTAGTATSSAAPKRPEPAPTAHTPIRKLSYKDKHALETLPSRLTTLQREISRLTIVLDDADLYARQPARFTEATQALATAQAELAAAEEQWLELEIRREELEGA